jgi:ATP-dependent protease ClpP protease subunit
MKVDFPVIIKMSAAHQINLYGNIGAGLFEDGNDAKSIVDQIKAAGSNPIDLHIHSSGGSLFDGYTIFNALQAHTPGVNVYVDGLAASIAAYIAMAGKTVNMAENSMMMIHNPTMDGGRMDIKKMQKQMSLLDKVTKSYADAFTRRGVLTPEQVQAMMDAETWMTAPEALLAGLCDDITPEMALAASFDLSQFQHVPEELVAQAGTRPSKKPGSPQSPPKGYPTSKDQYADPENYKYPIDTADRTRAAWSYINKAENRKGYSASELTYIENRIKSAAKKFGIKISEGKTKEGSQGSVDIAAANMETVIAQETKPTPEPKPAPEPEPPPPAGDASVLEKLKTLLRPKNDMLAEITALRTQIEVRDASIKQLNDKIESQAREIESFRAKAENMPALEALIKQLETEKMTVSDAARDQIAAMGFPNDKLPAQTVDKPDDKQPAKNSDEILAELNAITDPKEFTKKYRELEKDLRAALGATDLRAARRAKPRPV